MARASPRAKKLEACYGIIVKVRSVMQRLSSELMIGDLVSVTITMSGFNSEVFLGKRP
ncbi:hypothetical protein COLO4_36209 [Corchorus olitorius]|uniref:Uncharacterized protein n=1 Tax=Corchorus olitorius TaxID=93759 RepID=A0A1R3GAJ7_9ROSI|nr:hypothetical protein COLO4_36209 [Corchorus olitorius]